MKSSNIVLLIVMSLIITACSTGRYQQLNDSTPDRLPNKTELKDAIPRAEAYSRGGNKNYRVRGIDYQVLPDAQDFEETGIASWYGNKFHGHLTSNGEIYDMYAMSAAHKNLPLPTYVKVTNLTNNKSIIVRVNDRGPFHQNRIIDLSYSAAYKLDMLKTGTAKVKITAITEASNNTKVKIVAAQKEKVTSVTNSVKNVIQVFATSKLELAQLTADSLAKQYSQTVHYPMKDGIYRIQIGPITNESALKRLLSELKASQYPNAYIRRL